VLRPGAASARRLAGALAGVALLVMACAALAAPPARAATPGVNVELNDFNEHGAAMVAKTGARWVRAFVWWGNVQPGPGAWDAGHVAALQRGARAAHDHHLKVMIVALGTPAWASANGRLNGPPARTDAYAEFVSGLARRLRPHVAAYEIWNEEDLELFWGGPPDPAAYARLLRAAYPAVKGAAPRAKIVFGGLTGGDYDFVDAAYRAGAKGAFDALGVHTDIPCHPEPPEHFIRDPNGWISRWSFLGYRSVRRVMLAHGDRRPIWMTELGWTVSTVPCATGVWAGTKPAGVSERRQADVLRRAYACLRRDRYVGVALWFTLRDNDPAETVRYGLLRNDGTRRRAWSVFEDVVARPPAPSSCRPRYGGPHVTARAIRGRGGNPIGVRARVVARLGVRRVSFRLDGRTFKRVDRPRTVVSARIPARWLRATRHVVTVVASDTASNGGRATVVLRPR
jgi:hypothetical protein